MKKIFALVVIILFSVFSIYPVLYVLTVSLRTDQAFQANQLNFFGDNTGFQNFTRLITETDFLIWFRNSVLVSGTSTILGVTMAATAAYALSRYSFKAKRWILFSLLTTQMFPATMLMLPFFIILAKLQLINSFMGLFIIYASTALPFCIWQMKAYYDTLPIDLEEAALLDGCSKWQVFYKIILPISSPALVITGLFSFMAAWSEYMIAAIVLQDPALYTLPLGLKSFQASLATQWGLYAAAALIVSIPVVLLFFMLSRYLISGLTVGSVKG
ncbi:MAG: carbohydrate ABC transporter permease [Bdellovibrionota bacterium]